MKILTSKTLIKCATILLLLTNSQNVVLTKNNATLQNKIQSIDKETKKQNSYKIFENIPEDSIVQEFEKLIKKSNKLIKNCPKLDTTEILKEKINNLIEDYKKILDSSCDSYADFMCKREVQKCIEEYLKGEKWFTEKIISTPNYSGKQWDKQQIKKHMYWCEDIYQNQNNPGFLNGIKAPYIQEAKSWANLETGNTKDRDYLLTSSGQIKKLKLVYEKAIKISQDLEKTSLS